MIIAFNDRIVFYSILECKHDDGSDHEDKSHALNLAEQEDRRCQDPFFFFFKCLASPCGTWDLSSPNRDQTCAPYIGSVESQPLDHQGSPCLGP